MWSRGIALLFLDHRTRRGVGSASLPGRSLLPWKDAVPIVQEAGWAPGLVRTGAENLAPTEILSPDRPALNQSLFISRWDAKYSEQNFWWCSFVPPDICGNSASN